MNTTCNGDGDDGDDDDDDEVDSMVGLFPNFIFFDLADKTLRRIPTTTYRCRDRRVHARGRGVVVVAHRRT